MVDAEQPGPEGEAPALEIQPASARLLIGATLSRSFGFYVRHLPVLGLLSAVVYFPLYLYQVDFLEGLYDGTGRSETTWAALLLLALYFLLPLILQVFVTLAVFQHLRGDRPRPLRSILRGLLSLLPALGLALLFLLIMAGVLLLTAIPMGMISSVLEDTVERGTLNGIVGLLALSWVFCVYFVAPQALVVERLFPWTALGRSRVLTHGSRWRIFAIVVVLVALLWGVGLAIDAVLPDVNDSWSAWRQSIGIHLGVMALFSAFVAVSSAVAYHDLRRIKDGVSVEELIQVFA